LTLKAYENKAAFSKALMQVELDKLNDVTNKIEKHYYTKIVYKHFNYKPLYSFIPAIKVFVQLPFLFAAYRLLISYPPLDGASFGIIDDLSKPFVIAVLNSVLINPLPLLMTLISLIDIYLNKEVINYKERVIIAVTSLFFCLILYNSPSAIILYWLTSNVLSLFIATFIGNDIKNRIGFFLLKYLFGAYTIVKSKLFLFYLLIFNGCLIFSANQIDLVLALHGLVLSSAFILVYMLANFNKLYYFILSIAILSLIFVLGDNVFFPFLSRYLDYKISILLIFLSLLILKKRVSLIKISNFFILLNFTYLLCSPLIAESLKEPYPKFSVSNQRTNPVSRFIAAEVENKNNVIIIVLDGYPSGKVLSGLGIANNLDSILKGYVPEEFSSNFISTPISLSNLFFDVKFKKHEILKTGQNEELLFHDAYSASSLFPLDTMYYDEVWYSLIKSNSTLGFSYWKSMDINSILHIHLKTRSKENMIIRYNNQIMNSLRKDVHVNSKIKKFCVYHFLTFHHLNSIQDKVNYANDIISSILGIIPKNYSVLFFSDHGLREDSMSIPDQKSAIFYSKRGND
jgi:hypothetical protein